MPAEPAGPFPATRYQGSKLKLLDWIWQGIAHLSFDRCLDLFSGTACVSYRLKREGKEVTANDYLGSNQVVARALVVNNGAVLPEDRVEALLAEALPRYDDFIARTFSGVFFLDAENAWLDRVAQNVDALPPSAERDLALFALYQACLAKRPFNLFHRANLSLRTADVARSFGNKATWDRPFADHLRAAVKAANRAVFDSGRAHRALREDFLEVTGSFDLVYMDPPYLNARGTGVDYLDFYHFLEGLTEYRAWPERIDASYKHRPYRRRPSPWARRETILGAFGDALEKYREAIIVISYRSDGIPSVDDLTRLLRRHGRRDARQAARDYQYVLSPARGQEVLLVSEP
jgi:adenine-specific DNA-methyltransferase